MSEVSSGSPDSFDDEDMCKLKESTGECHAYMERFYFDFNGTNSCQVWFHFAHPLFKAAENFRILFRCSSTAVAAVTGTTSSPSPTASACARTTWTSQKWQGDALTHIHVYVYECTGCIYYKSPLFSSVCSRIHAFLPAQVVRLPPTVQRRPLRRTHQHVCI